MADQDDQTAVRVSGGVIYGEVCVCVLSDVCACVWPHSAPGSFITYSLQSRGGFVAACREAVIAPW